MAMDDEEGTPDFLSCENCGGNFYHGDMDGDHCQDCAEILFGRDDA